MNRTLLTISLTVATLVSAQDDQPGRSVARVSLLNGDVTVKRGDSGDVVAAAVNAPLMVQDRLLTGPGARAEVQYDNTNFLRLGPDGDLRLREVEYRKYMVELGRGVITWHVGRDNASDIDINTPSIAIRPVRPGDYRVSVREDGTTEITVRRGEAEIYSEKGVQRLREGKTMLVRGVAGDPEFQLTAEIGEDDWDRWNVRRDREIERSASRQYMPNDVLGAEELDQHGQWMDVAPYGRVWSPRVADGWAPYQYGRWAWTDYYGWNWVSYDPFGWAPFHYGRWFWNANRWCWWPGSTVGRAWWRPALVAWFGFGGVGVGVGFNRWGWVPLAPFEPFHPWYGSRFYRGGFGGTTIVNNVRVINNYNIVNNYRNARVNGAVSGVEATRFGRGYSSGYERVSDANLRNANLMQGQLPASPGRESLSFNDRQLPAGSAGLRGGAADGQFHSRRAASTVDRVPFAEQQRGFEQASAGVRGGGMNGFSGTDGGGLRGDGASVARNDGAQSSGGGWRRFGEPAYSNGGSPSGGGVRGGDASRGGAVYGTEADRSANTRGNGESGWRRFGGSPAEGGGTRGSTVYGGESVRVNPPAVYDRGSSGGYRGDGSGSGASVYSSPGTGSGGYRGSGNSGGYSTGGDAGGYSRGSGARGNGGYSTVPDSSGAMRGSGGYSGGGDTGYSRGSGGMRGNGGYSTVPDSSGSMRGSGGYSGSGDSGYGRGSGGTRGNGGYSTAPDSSGSMRGSGGYSGGGDSGYSRGSGGSRGGGGYSTGGDSGYSRGSGGYSGGGGMRGGDSGYSRGGGGGSSSGGFSSGGGSMRGGGGGAPSGGGFSSGGGGGMRGGGGGGASGGMSGGGGGGRGGSRGN